MLPTLIIAGPRWVPLTKGSSETPAAFTILTSNSQHTVIELEIIGIYVDDINTPAGQFQSINLGIQVGGVLTTVGSPQLPVIARFIGIPDDRDVDIKILNQETVTLSGYNILPAQPPQPENAPAAQFLIDEKRYTTDRFYPETVIQLSEPMIMRDFRLVQLVLQPVQFNPVSRELIVTRRLRLELRYDRSSRVNIKSRHPGKISRAFEPLYRSFIANYRFLAPPQRAEEGSYLIIVNDQFAAPSPHLLNGKDARAGRPKSSPFRKSAAMTPPGSPITSIMPISTGQSRQTMCYWLVTHPSLSGVTTGPGRLMPRTSITPSTKETTYLLT